MITVYGFPKTRSTRVTWMLEELGIEYQFVLVNFEKDEMKKEPFLSINPAGKVPAISDQGLLLTESAAIIAYLGDKHPEKNLIPKAGTIQRGIYDQWGYFALCELEQPLWTIGKHKFALPKQWRNPAIFNTAEWEYQKALTLFSQGLGDKPFILGDLFSGADILLGHTLLWGVQFKQVLEQSNLNDYLQRLKERPALSRAYTKESQSA